jgi:hypothetical protein
VIIPVPEISVLQAIGESKYRFSLLSRLLVTYASKLLFSLELAVVKKVIMDNDGRYSVLPEKLPNGVYKIPFVFIPVFCCAIAFSLIASNKLFPYIVQETSQ